VRLTNQHHATQRTIAARLFAVSPGISQKMQHHRDKNHQDYRHNYHWRVPKIGATGLIVLHIWAVSLTENRRAQSRPDSSH
jgi:hypothetical protein